MTGRHLDLSPAFAHSVSLLAWENSAQRLHFAGNVVVSAPLTRDSPAMLASKSNRDKHKSFGGTNFSLTVFKKILREKMKNDAVLSEFLQQSVVTSVARRFPAMSQQELENNPYETWVLWLQGESQAQNDVFTNSMVKLMRSNPMYGYTKEEKQSIYK